jgi:hypothetical protein
MVTRSGDGSYDKSIWPYMKSMSFLAPYIKPRATYTATKVVSCSGSIASTSSMYFRIITRIYHAF